jgi:hydroxypyruvate reductase
VRLLEWMNEAGTDARFLFLISGGASSLVEAPVQGIDLATLQRINQWLLASGLSIGQINRVRRKISRIKGGNLLHFLHGRQAKVWLLSDVAADNPEVIGSGLLYPGDDKPRQDVTFPDWLDDVLKTVPAPARVEETIPEHRVLANLAVACEAAAGQATAQGLQATLCRRVSISGVGKLPYSYPMSPGAAGAINIWHWPRRWCWRERRMSVFLPSGPTAAMDPPRMPEPWWTAVQ